MDATTYREEGHHSSEFLPGELELIAPRPRSVAECGLTLHFLQGLLVKHLAEGGVMDLQQLSRRTALASPVIQEVLDNMRRDAWIEVHGPAADTSSLRYALTDRGKAAAAEALLKSGYTGPAPVPLCRYHQIVRAQSIHLRPVTQANMNAAFADIVIRETLLDRLGAALHSGRAIFVYGPAGTGKTYISQRLAWLHNDAVLIPHAIEIDHTVIQVFDPSIHQPETYLDNRPNMMLEQGFDPRFVLCRRPAVLTGGELTLDMLEIQYEASTRQYQAPLQLKANNGVYIIDDLGRQRVAPVDLFNRWIVPLESQEDYLNLRSGKRLAVPFDVVLIFSTNLNPAELADEAFLRRLGHKISFNTLQPDEYRVIWRQVCEDRGIPFEPGLVEFAIDGLHAKFNVPLLPCHPRDLLSMALDHSRYIGNTPLTPELLETAWHNYFVNLKAGAPAA